MDHIEKESGRSLGTAAANDRMNTSLERVPSSKSFALSRENSSKSVHDHQNEDDSTRLNESWFQQVLTNARESATQTISDPMAEATVRGAGIAPEPPSGANAKTSHQPGDPSDEKKAPAQKDHPASKTSKSTSSTGEARLRDEKHPKSEAEKIVEGFENGGRVPDHGNSNNGRSRILDNDTSEYDEKRILCEKASGSEQNQPTPPPTEQSVKIGKISRASAGNLEGGNINEDSSVEEVPPRRSTRESAPGAFRSDGTETVPTQPVRYSLLAASTHGQNAEDESASMSQLETTAAPIPPLPASSNGDNNNTTRGSSNFLVVANPISSHFMQLAEEVGNSDDSRRTSQASEKSNLLLAGTISVVLLVGLTLLLVVLLTGTSTDDDSNNITGTVTPDAGPTPAPSLGIETYVQSLLPEYTVTALRSPSSAQSLAYQWLLDDPALTNYPAWRIQQRLALAILFFSTDGDNWNEATHWLSYDHHECDWYSSTFLRWDLAKEEFGTILEDIKQYFADSVCQEGKYNHLRLHSNRLQGTVPQELGWLSSLKTLLLFINDITGSIPTEIGHLNELEIFGCVACFLTGQVPTEIGLLSNLIGIGVYVNPFLNSTLPTELGLLEKLEAAYLGGTDLFGTIPTELGQLTNIISLWTGGNELEGSLPSELGLLTQMMEFSASRNNMTGEIPLEIWSLQHMSHLELQSNKLEGSLPTEIGLLTSATWLSLSENSLKGSLPLQLSHLTGLEELYLGSNAFTGSLPSSIGRLRNLTRLVLSNTTLTGQLPSELGLLTKLTRLDLLDNPFLTGTIPEGLCSHGILFTCSETLCGCDCSCTGT
ncbi:Leucine Rich Repeat [Seminavis robusta]|uniref:Leucine Rich Repeat n=1 Tax=Seminavis robusta TaxID=568900 RepID=A0A9N8ESE6_9STRA|nr:Leucine Rich Repeat [Seminavis robusta]|eukprot:Sro1644_g288160.1 Leucine Rich Repeat (826) ;mRNA; f:4570-7158